MAVCFVRRANVCGMMRSTLILRSERDGVLTDGKNATTRRPNPTHGRMITRPGLNPPESLHRRVPSIESVVLGSSALHDILTGPRLDRSISLARTRSTGTLDMLQLVRAQSVDEVVT
jgi:hypothetical protein